MNKKLIAISFCVIFLISSLSCAGVSVLAGPRQYDFQDTVNNKAYAGTNDTRPLPALVGSNEYEFSSTDLNKIAFSDDVWQEYNAGADIPDYSDYHRFAFKIFEPVSTITSLYMEHEGYGRNYYYSLNPGLTLYIWNNDLWQWEYLDDHNQSSTDAITSGTITSNIEDYINSTGYLNLLAQAKELVGSCPFLYTFNGEKFVFVTDMYNRGMLGMSDPKRITPEDYAKIETDQLLQNDGLYKLQITQEYDEISFLDQLTLMTVDHPSNVEVFPSLLKEPGKIYTVSKDLSTPVSAFDKNGNDVLKQISTKDGTFTIADQFKLNLLDLNLGDLSGASDIKLVITAYTNWDNVGLLTRTNKTHMGQSVQVKDSGGNWVTVYSNELITPSAMPRTYVLNLTGKFITDDYSVRLSYYPDFRFDYIGIDTSPEVKVTVNNLDPIYADLHFRGYSVMNGYPSIPNYYDFGPNPIEGYSYPAGNFTRFGDVLPLVIARDDKFLILHHGDEISACFTYVPAEDGLERDFLLYSWGYYKGSEYPTGNSVEPLPFYGMSSYPYGDNESYPNDADHLAYLTEYNTREYSGSSPVPNEHGTIWTDYVMVQVTTEQHPVGGFIVPENYLQILAPWVLAAAIATVISLVAIRGIRPYLRH